MKKLLKNARIFVEDEFINADMLIDENIISQISPSIEIDENFDGVVFDFNNCYIFPGLSDVHVHLREPGFSRKETVKTGTQAAARGGFTNVCTMPNLSPVPDTLENLKAQLDIIDQDAVINVYPYGAITTGEKGEMLADLEAMAPYVIGFSDDGKGVQSTSLMKKAMVLAKKIGKPIIAHCEDESLLEGGYIHDGEYAKAHGHRGICSESEFGQIERDIILAGETGVQYHICHMSTKEGVELVREAKTDGVNVSVETAPHYLILTDMDLQEDGRFKMNPPIRSAEDREALINGIVDGTIDMIITDHAPHTAEEKSLGLEKSAMGIVGLETSFAASYTALVKSGKISLEKLIDLMHGAPMRKFGIGTELDEGEPADLTVFNLDEKFTVDPSEFISMGKATPFTGMEFYGVCKMTISNGEIVYREE